MQGAYSPESGISHIGDQIDEIIGPITGFRVQTDAASEIIQRLRTGPTLDIDPKMAPLGAIIVSPTQFAPYGPIHLGHAGILGPDHLICSADARYEGVRVRNFTLEEWITRFSHTNGTYAFVVHAPCNESGINR
jgi:hypothetical protein